MEVLGRWLSRQEHRHPIHPGHRSDGLLKLGCLHAGVPPKEGSYEKAAKHLFEDDGGNRDAVPKNLAEVLRDADWVLKRISDMGSPSHSTLPSWPPVHVLAAIRSHYLGIEDPERRNEARRLIDAYYWRALFTNRHERQANDHLYADFRQLANVLSGEGAKADSMRVFSDRHHPLYRAPRLEESAGWIGRSRIGKALLSAVLASEPRPVDWITGEPSGQRTSGNLRRPGTWTGTTYSPRRYCCPRVCPKWRYTTA